ncbi:MAG: hypothetical protein AUH69_09535 [Actinobacteria bacterium 13_1_40CM_4_65_12]|nr:MAG: hypothetical protein AUH69_09535 [Actinobacteria bacterium 13_1_40CM_4_65_12]
MTLDRMRSLDRVVGSVVCLVLSLVHLLLSLLRPVRTSVPPRNILIIEISEMGCLVLAYPMLEALKRRYPGAILYFLMFEKLRGSAEVLNLAPQGQHIVLRDRSLGVFLVDAVRAVWQLRRCKIDTVLDLELFSRASAILSYLSGASNRVGFHRYHTEGLYRGNFLTHKVPYNLYLHIAKNYMALLDALEDSASGTPPVKKDYGEIQPSLPKIRNSEEETLAIREKLKQACPALVGSSRIVLLNPGGGELPIRAWPLANYVQLAEMLLELPGLAVGVVGLAGDRVWYERMAETIRSPRFFNLAGLTPTVREVVQVFNQCDILVTSDGGLAHFAGLSTIHCIVFFGPETPVLYGPLASNYTCLYAGISCSPCLSAYNARKSPCDGDNVCVKLFSPEHVKGLVLEALRARA